MEEAFAHGLGGAEASVRPTVSVLIVARNTGALIGDAILSARQQSLRDIEIVVVDDASTDDTRAVAERHASEDARVRVLDGPRAGLAAIRNTSLDAARGRWAAILDSDDMLHPRHLEHLVGAAKRTDAEIVAANMVVFSVEAGITRTALFADREDWLEERWLTPVLYVRANSASHDAVSAGYLKPLFDVEFLRRHRLSYDLRLRIAEDYDLVARALAAGARYRYLPHPTYFYRRHAQSTSHRQSVADLSGMLAAADSALAGSHDPELLEAVAARTASIRSALRHVRAIEALKARRPWRAIVAMGPDRGAWRLMAQTFVEGTGRRLRRATDAGPAPPPCAVLVGRPEPASALAGKLARFEKSGRLVAHRDAPGDARSRALLADGLPPVTEIFVAHPGTLDDAAYLMAPSVERETR